MAAVLMPMTSPNRLTSGPPLLPGFMEASVWIKSTNVSCGPASMEPSECADHTTTDGGAAGQGEGVADGNDLLAYEESAGAAGLGRLQIVCIDL